MKLVLAKTPKFVQWFINKRIWAFSRSSNTVYLTFDDGPIPEITPWVLSELKKYNAKATFFCIGDNIIKHPAIFQELSAQGHSIGNHTQHHLNGWKTPHNAYLEEVILCESLIKETTRNSPITKLFRPPYGKLTSRQATSILKKGYSIIMWDVLSKDYDSLINQTKCLANVISNIQPGSIVVFHDSFKAAKNLKFVLPKVLEHIYSKGWNCENIAIEDIV